jgi:hypothetical protein
MTIRTAFYFFLLLIYCRNVFSQNEQEIRNWFSLGMRSTISGFSDDGWGLGTGGQFRIQFNQRLNSDWFADYISINIKDKVKSEYAHIGWSVLYYPFKKMLYPSLIQAYVLAGHCFDYNKKTVIVNPAIFKDRWGSAVQAGTGMHVNITNRFDISFTAQYMIHLTSEISFEETNNEIKFNSEHHNALTGHLLLTLSVNYKVFAYGKKN